MEGALRSVRPPSAASEQVFRLAICEDQFSMDSREYRMVLGVPALGFVTIAGVVYAVLSSAGVTDYKLFSKLNTFDLQDKGILLFLALWCAGGILLVGLGRVRVVITDEGIHYRGIVRSRYIRWSEVTCLHPGGRPKSVYLRSESSLIEIPDLFRHQKELSDTIFERVRANAPSAEVHRRHGFFGSWKKGTGS